MIRPQDLHLSDIGEHPRIECGVQVHRNGNCKISRLLPFTDSTSTFLTSTPFLNLSTTWSRIARLQRSVIVSSEKTVLSPASGQHEKVITIFACPTGQSGDSVHYSRPCHRERSNVLISDFSCIVCNSSRNRSLISIFTFRFSDPEIVRIIAYLPIICLPG